MAVTRRSLIVAAGVAAAAVLPDHRIEAASSPPPPLPPPLPAELFRERQRRLRDAARAHGWDAVMATPSTNLSYAANLSIGRSERLTALLLFTDGPSVLVTPNFEEGNHRKTVVVDDVRTWKEDEDPIALVAKLLEDKKSLGIEGSTAYETVVAVGTAFPGKLENATPIFDAQRRVKAPEEQVLIRAAGERTTRAIAATHRRLKRGMTEQSVAAILSEEFSRLDVTGDGLVQFGPDAAYPHGGPADRILARGDVVLIDAGCKVRHYTSDVTRTVAFGAASDDVRRVYQTVERAQSAGIAALRAGAIPEEVDRAARRVIEEAGFGEFFTHRLGHGLGMDGHESPYLVHGNRTPLVAGNTVTIEPGIYMPGKFGVRIEDDYAVRAGEPEGLSERALEIQVIGD